MAGAFAAPAEVSAGVRASRLIAVGEPIVRSALVSGVVRARVVSIPIARDHAAGGDLVAGDVVDVIDFSQSPARFVASGLTVVAVAPKSSGATGLDAGGGSWWVSVEVTAPQALAVSDALARSKLLLVRATGQPPVSLGGG